MGILQYFLVFTEQDLEQLHIADDKQIPCNSKCFVEGDTCVAIIDCCENLPEKPKNCVCLVTCNGKVFKSNCGGAKKFLCKCNKNFQPDCKSNYYALQLERDNNAFVLFVEENPKKCIVVCDCKNGGICVSFRDCNVEGDACGKSVETGENCTCECYIDKEICVAVVKC